MTGGAEGIRTPDFLLAKEALSRAELQPHVFSRQLTAYSYQLIMGSPGDGGRAGR